MKTQTTYTKNQLIVGCIIGLLFGIFLTAMFLDSNSETEVYKIILRADNQWSEISLDSMDADYYYELAGYAYEDDDDEGVINNCKIAREYYSKESQGYRKIKAGLEASNIDDKLVDIYIEATDEIIIAKDNLYEACEYFESAARYYKNENYDMGGKEIDLMNDKINNHDESIRKYNSLIEDFGVELEKRME